MAAAGIAMVLVGCGVAGGVLRLGARGEDLRVSAEMPVTAMDQTRMPSNNSPLLAADPADERFVAMANRLDAPDFGCALQLSGDGGRTWSPADAVPKLPGGAEKCYAPEVAFDGDGALYFLFVGLRGRGNEPMGAFLTVSQDRGRTFSSPKEVLGPLNFGVRMAIDPTMGASGRIHLLWLHAGADPALGGFAAVPNPILHAWSDDRGRTFSPSVQVSDADRRRVVAPALALGADHRVHVAYYDLQGDARDYQGLDGPVWEGTWSVVVSTSLDGGRRFGPGAVVDDEVTPPDRPMLIFTMAPPSLVASPARVCAAWTDGRRGDPDAMLRCSRDRGRTWGRLHRINTDRAGNGLRQYLPRLSAAPDGRLDAVFLDRRHSPANDMNDVSYTFSTDGGDSFAPVRRLTRQSSYSLIGQRYANPSAEGQYEFGGRLGLLSRPASALVAWPDTRFSRLGTGQDLFASEVALSDRGQPLWARVGGGALALGGVGLVAMPPALRRRRVPAGPDERELAPDTDRRAPQAEPGGDLQPGEEPPSGRPSVPSPWRRRFGWLAGAAVLSAGAAFVLGDGGPSRTRHALPPPPQIVDVAMDEYRFGYRAPALVGQAVFRVRNVGAEEHRLSVFLLPESLPPIDAQLKGDNRQPISPYADLPNLRPGGTQTIALDLRHGKRYALVCLLETAAEKSHARMGMNSEFRGGGGPAGPTTTGAGR